MRWQRNHAVLYVTSEDAVYLVRAHAFLAGAHEIDGL